jgi:hypothetical protein
MQSVALKSNEFGTGLRARLDLVRERREDSERLAKVLQFRSEGSRDLSPELALVSPDYAQGLGELLLGAHEARQVPLGALLAEAGLLESAELDFALAHAREHGKRLGEVLVEQGLVTPAEVVRLVAAQRGLPFVDVRGLVVDPAAAKLLPAPLARDNRALPVGFVRGLPVVAVADPTDDDAMQGTRSVLHCVRFVASPEEAILFQLDRVYISLGATFGAAPRL